MNLTESRLQCDFCANCIYEEVNYLNDIIMGIYDCSPVFYLGQRLIACPECIKKIKEEKSLRNK